MDKKPRLEDDKEQRFPVEEAEEKDNLISDPFIQWQQKQQSDQKRDN